MTFHLLDLEVRDKLEIVTYIWEIAQILIRHLETCTVQCLRKISADHTWNVYAKKNKWVNCSFQQDS